MVSNSTASTTAAVAAATAKPAAQGLTLEFWNEANDQPELSVMEDLVAKFNKQQPDFQAKNIPVVSGTNYEKYTAAMAGGTPPDAIMTYSWQPVPGWAYQGALLPLDAYMAQMKISQSDYFPIVWSMVFLHGHLWGFLQEFDSLWFDCLNGDSRETGKLTPEGRPDPSVFSTEYNREGIRVGTAIATMIRRRRREESQTSKKKSKSLLTSSPTSKTGDVFFRQFWGVDKHAQLLESLKAKSFAKQYERANPIRSNRLSFRVSDVGG